MEKRCFVSIDLPHNIKDYLASLSRHDIYWIKWINPRNLHMTLNFLGDLNAERIDSARETIANVAQNFRQFNLRLTDLKTQFDMLWLLPEYNEELIQLQDELKDSLKSARLGKRERRSFSPHILLGKSKTGRPMRQVIENFLPQEFRVDRINLYESELTPGAATHRLIQRFPLIPETVP